MRSKLFTLLFGLILLPFISPSLRAQNSSPLEWRTDFSQALTNAKSTKQPMIVDFHAPWCGPCRRLDAEVFPDPAVAERLEKFIRVKVNVDEDSETAFKFQVSSIPRTIIFNIHGQPIADRIGFMEPEDYAALLDDALENAQEKIAEQPEPSADDVDVIMQSPESAVAAPNAATLNQPLLQLLGSPDPNLRLAAAERIVRYPTRALPILFGALNDDYLGTRIAARAVLLKLGAPVESFDPWAAKSDRTSSLTQILTAAQSTPPK